MMGNQSTSPLVPNIPIVLPLSRSSTIRLAIPRFFPNRGGRNVFIPLIDDRGEKGSIKPCASSRKELWFLFNKKCTDVN